MEQQCWSLEARAEKRFSNAGVHVSMCACVHVLCVHMLQVMRLFEASRIHMTSLKQEAALRDDDGEKSSNRKQKNSPQRHKHSFLLHPKQQQKHQQQHASRREDSFTVHMGCFFIK